MAKRDPFVDSVIYIWLASAGHVVHVHPKRVAKPVREERAAYTRRQDRLLGIPRS